MAKRSVKKAKKSPTTKKSAGINASIAKAFLHLNNQLGGAILMQRTYMVTLFGRLAKEVPAFNPEEFLEALYGLQSNVPSPSDGDIESAGMNELKYLIELTEEMLREIRKN